MFYHVQALIKEARDQAKMLMEDAEREAREKYVVTMRPFGDAEKYLLAGGGGVISVSISLLSIYFICLHTFTSRRFIYFFCLLPFPKNKKY